VKVSPGSKGELEPLVTVERATVTARLKDAVETDGDLARNRDYLDAKEEEALVEQRIALLAERLACARIIDAYVENNGVVTLGARVRLRELGTTQIGFQISATKRPRTQPGRGGNGRVA
jgi:transcription elongation GreA/GreB family factor